MRIIMIGQKGIPAAYGGIERHVEDLTRELAQRGHEVLAYARAWYTPKPIKNYHGVRVIHTPTLHTKHLDTIAHTFTSVIHALFQKPDIIHFHGVGPSLLSWIPRLLARKAKVVATFHCIDRYHQKWGYFAKLALRLGEWAACRFPHETIAVSRTIQNYCFNEYQKSASYVTNGVRISTQLPNADILPQWNLQPDKYVLMVSRLVRHKSAHCLIESWLFACRRYPALLQDYKLVIAGDSAFTDSYVKQLRRLACGNESIVFTGWQRGANLTALYGCATLLLHPSENEGAPLTVLQAMALGKPVLVSDIPEHKEIIADDRFRFSVNNINSLADKIVQLLKNPELLRQTGAINKQIAFDRYNWKNLINEVLKIYHKDKRTVVSKLKPVRV